MSTYQTQGIILKKTDRGEADQLFSLYTENHGKVLALGKATKKIQSKLNPNLQFFAVSDLMIAPGKAHDHIAAVNLTKNFLDIKKDLKKIVLASFALELIEKLTKLAHPDPKIFILLSKYLFALDTHYFKNSDWQIIKQAFSLKLLTLLGFKPTQDIINDTAKFDKFLENHLDAELETDKFLTRMHL